jgi:hypothetical protein
LISIRNCELLRIRLRGALYKGLRLLRPAESGSIGAVPDSSGRKYAAGEVEYVFEGARATFVSEISGTGTEALRSYIHETFPMPKASGSYIWEDQISETLGPSSRVCRTHSEFGEQINIGSFCEKRTIPGQI